MLGIKRDMHAHTHTCIHTHTHTCTRTYTHTRARARARPFSCSFPCNDKSLHHPKFLKTIAHYTQENILTALKSVTDALWAIESRISALERQVRTVNLKKKRRACTEGGGDSGRGEEEGAVVLAE